MPEVATSLRRLLLTVTWLAGENIAKSPLYWRYAERLQLD